MPRRSPNTQNQRSLTAHEIAALPPALDLATAGRLLGISRATAYRLAATGDLPVPVIPVGRSLKVPTAPLLALLGLTPPRDAPVPHGAGTAGGTDGADPDAAGRAARAAGTAGGADAGASDEDARPDGLINGGPGASMGKPGPADFTAPVRRSQFPPRADNTGPGFPTTDVREDVSPDE
jgi:predicted DNA-binding transcriptional regulator AlpA